MIKKYLYENSWHENSERLRNTIKITIHICRKYLNVNERNFMNTIQKQIFNLELSILNTQCFIYLISLLRSMGWVDLLIAIFLIQFGLLKRRGAGEHRPVTELAHQKRYLIIKTELKYNYNIKYFPYRQHEILVKL